jgi:hypothetical protein
MEDDRYVRVEMGMLDDAVWQVLRESCKLAVLWDTVRTSVRFER